MILTIETRKDVETATRGLEAATLRNGFGVLQIYDLPAKMREKGIAFAGECRILEVCNPKQAAAVLSKDMSVSLALPCRISVYREGGVTKIGTLRPTALLALFPGAAELQDMAREVEATLMKIIMEAA
jgi:uncharacterized protein (DUF302 family)